jgi:Cellulose binding domain
MRAVLAIRPRSGRPPRSARHGATQPRTTGAGGAAQPGRLTQPGGPVRPLGAARAARPVHGMLMTPWLAAGVGVVVAAVLALNVPRAVLTYSQTNPGAQCQAPSCAHVPPAQQHGGLAAKDPGTELRHHKRPAAPLTAPAAKGPAARGHARNRKPRQPVAPVDVQYQILRRWPTGFTGLITIMSRATLSGWRLAFRYPGVHIDSVAGAKWNARGDGGVASAVPWPWGGPPGNIVRILIVANGVPGQPTSCRFDGARCSFG